MNLARLKKYLFQNKTRTLLVFAGFVALILSASYLMSRSLEKTYNELLSLEIKDRNGVTIKKFSNARDLYASPIDSLPKNLEELLLKKEDRFFYFHPGVNPVSTFRAAFSYLKDGYAGGSSAITQQLVKILLGNEQDRTIGNKLNELLYVLALEIQLSKSEIMTMYVNSVYLGNQAQGFAEASKLYFGKTPDDLTEQEMIQLLATLSSPSAQNPWRTANDDASLQLAGAFEVPIHDLESTKSEAYSFQQPSFFEVHSLGVDCDSDCSLTLDGELNEKVREILNRNISYSYDRGVKNGAVVIIKVPENELLGIVGSRDPDSLSEGSRINMALEPRPIGSTVKPFIYGKGFEMGLRPYTLVEDREYKYPIATGFSLYPKNYDGKFRGTITLHEALSNSLNVPTVKTLEYIGLDEFYDFLENDLHFLPIQELHTYQYGIALGGLEMDLLTLTHYFTLLANNGTLSPLRVGYGTDPSIIKPPQSDLEGEEHVIDKKYVQLVNKILNDRTTGVNQFGLKSNLNLSQSNYAVKTGTSRDFHDSWVVGYTPDFIVGVWLGNSENTPLEQVSGQSGAGRVWQEVMELLFTTEYNKKTPFAFGEIIEIEIDDSIELGLLNDDVETVRNSMAYSNLILSPHDRDQYEIKENTVIPLASRVEVEWFIDGQFVERTSATDFVPRGPGTYEIEARTNNAREIISIEIIGDRY